jgi:hypothetical protein
MKISIGLFLLFMSFGEHCLAQPVNATSVIEADSLLNEAIMAHNLEIAGRLYHDEFILTTSSGSVKRKANMLVEIGSADLIMQINETQNVNVIVDGVTAILTGRLHQKGSYKGKEFDHYLLVTDTWVLKNGKWTLLAGHATLQPAR